MGVLFVHLVIIFDSDDRITSLTLGLLAALFAIASESAQQCAQQCAIKVYRVRPWINCGMKITGTGRACLQLLAPVMKP